MSHLPVLLIVWAAVAACFLALLAYRGQLTRYEEDQLFLTDNHSNEQDEQTEIIRKVNKIKPIVNIFGYAAALMTIGIVGIFTYDAWQHCGSYLSNTFTLPVLDMTKPAMSPLSASTSEYSFAGQAFRRGVGSRPCAESRDVIPATQRTPHPSTEQRNGRGADFPGLHYLYLSKKSGVVRRRRDPPSAPGPVGVEELAARLVDTLVGMRAEVVTLCL